MSNSRETSGGYKLMGTALAMAAEERDALEADLLEARAAIRRAVRLLTSATCGPDQVQEAVRLLRETLPDAEPLP